MFLHHKNDLFGDCMPHKKTQFLSKASEQLKKVGCPLTIPNYIAHLTEAYQFERFIAISNALSIQICRRNSSVVHRRHHHQIAVTS